MSLRPSAGPVAPTGSSSHRLRQVLAAGAARAAETGAPGNKKRSRVEDEDEEPWYGDVGIGDNSPGPEKWSLEISFKRTWDVNPLTANQGQNKMVEVSIRNYPYTAPGNAPVVEEEEAVAEALKGWMRAGFQMGDYASVSYIEEQYTAARRNYRVVIPLDKPTTNGFHEDVGPQLLKLIMGTWFREPAWYDWSLSNPRMKPGAGAVEPSRFDF